MTLKELKDWINGLPEDYMEFSVVNGDEGKLEGKYFYRVDKPVVSLIVDKESNEFVLLNQIEELNQDDINEIKEIDFPNEEVDYPN